MFRRIFIRLAHRALRPLHGFFACKDITIIKKRVAKADVVSFDIFDTVLVRKNCFSPVDIFRRVEEKSGCVGFAKARILAEDSALKKYRNDLRKRDVTLSQIYELIDSHFCRLKGIEIDEERESLCPNPFMYEIYQYALQQGKKVCFSSDMYLPQAVLAEFLRDNGYAIGDVHISSELNARKSDGRMFSFLRKLYKGGSIIHIGDNFESDYIAARVFGLKACYCMSPRESFLQEFPFVLKWLRSRASSNASEMLAKHIWNYTLWQYNNKGELSYWRKFGFVCAAPFLLSYARWIRKMAAIDDVHKVLFVARDGYVPQKVFARLFPDVQSAYIYAPRMLSCVLIGSDGASSDVSAERIAQINEFERRSTNIGVQFDEYVRSCSDEYCSYLFSISAGHTRLAIVDGPSASFSAQRLVEYVLGMPLKGYYMQIVGGNVGDGKWCKYTASFSKNDNGFFKEFLFSSPEPPIEVVKHGAPVYKGEVSDSEMRRIKIYSELAKGEEEGALMLSSESDFSIDDDWLSAFRDSPTKTDKRQFLSLRVAVNIGHTEYKQLFPEWDNNPIRRSVMCLKHFLFGNKLVSLRRCYVNGNGRATRILYLFDKIPIARW